MKKVILTIFCLILVATTATAHPGRTDENGGHMNYSTGEYHYHHGYSAHQHEYGFCPFDYDDQTDATSGTTSTTSNAEGATPAEPPAETAPKGYPNPVNYTIPVGSKMIDRTYYFTEDYEFMYVPWEKEALPHGETETDNTSFLQFGNPYIGDVIYWYGLENQSRQFQEGATFGLHEGWNSSDSGDLEDNAPQYQYNQDDGTYETAYNLGYNYALDILMDDSKGLISNVYLFLPTLRVENRKTGETALDEQNVTFETAFEEGYYQAEIDFYAYINKAILNYCTDDEIQELQNKSYQQGYDDAQNGHSIWDNSSLVLIFLVTLGSGWVIGYYYFIHRTTRTK